MRKYKHIIKTLEKIKLLTMAVSEGHRHTTFPILYPLLCSWDFSCIIVVWVL